MRQHSGPGGLSVRPLDGSLDDLLARLGQALDSQRGFTAEAAHGLRAPLTGVKWSWTTPPCT